MLRTFRAEKMLKRLEKEGRMHEVDAETLDFIKLLDGKQANDYNWQSFVYDEPLCWIEPDEDQDGTYVNANDCD